MLLLNPLNYFNNNKKAMQNSYTGFFTLHVQTFRTTFEQEGTITVSGIGWFNSLAEKCGAAVFSYGANKVGMLIPNLCQFYLECGLVKPH